MYYFVTGFFCLAYTYESYSYCLHISNVFPFMNLVFLFDKYTSIFIHFTKDNHLLCF